MLHALKKVEMHIYGNISNIQYADICHFDQYSNYASRHMLAMSDATNLHIADIIVSFTCSLI